MSPIKPKFIVKIAYILAQHGLYAWFLDIFGGLLYSLKTLVVFHFRKHKNVFALSIIDRHWDCPGSCDPSAWIQKTHLCYILNIMTVDDLQTEGGRVWQPPWLSHDTDLVILEHHGLNTTGFKFPICLGVTPAWVSIAFLKRIMMTPSNGNIFALLALCAANWPITGEFPAQRPATRSFEVFCDLRLNKRLSKQSWGCWSETPSCLLWRQCNVTYDLTVHCYWYSTARIT